MNTFEIIVRGPAGEKMDRVRNTIMRAVQTDLVDMVNAQVAPGWLSVDAITLSLRSEAYGKIDEKNVPKGFMGSMSSFFGNAGDSVKASVRETIEHYLGEELFGKEIDPELVNRLVEVFTVKPKVKKEAEVARPSFAEIASARSLVADALGIDVSEENVFPIDWVMNTAEIITQRIRAADAMNSSEQVLDDQGTLTGAPEEALELLQQLSDERSKVLEQLKPKGSTTDAQLDNHIQELGTQDQSTKEDPKRINCDEVREHVERKASLDVVDPNEDQFSKHRVDGQPDIAPPDEWAAPAIPRKEFVGLVHAKGAPPTVESAFSLTIDHAAREWKLLPGRPVLLRGIFPKEDNGNVPNILESFAATAIDVELVYYVENEAGEIVSAQTITEVAFGGLEDAGDDIHFDMYIKAQRTNESFAKADVAKRHRS